MQFKSFHWLNHHGKNKQQPPFGAYICSDICPQTLPVPRSEHCFRERSSRKTLNFEEQIMFEDKYPSICSCQMEAIVEILPSFSLSSVVLGEGERFLIRRELPVISWMISAPLRQYSGHFEFYCFKQLLWNVQGAVSMYLPPKYPILTIHDFHMTSSFSKLKTCNVLAQESSAVCNRGSEWV